MSRESTRAAERFVGQCIAGDVEVFTLQTLGQQVVSFKMLELALDYLTVMRRYEFMMLKSVEGVLRIDTSRAYLRIWEEALVAEKIRQFNIADKTQWPRVLPWVI